MSVRYELNYFPLAVMHIGAANNDDEALDTLIETATKILLMQQKYALVIYANHAMHAKQRALFAAWEKQNAALLAQYYLGAGFVMKSTLVRGAMTALRWIAPAAQPELITASPLEAAKFCMRLLEEARAPELDRARRYLTLVSASTTGPRKTVTRRNSADRPPR